MSTENRWVLLSEFGSGFEADMIVQALEAEDILHLRTQPEAGIFGAGFGGPLITGIQIFVADQDFDRAKDIVSAFNGE